jgi:hypothetical protein
VYRCLSSDCIDRPKPLLGTFFWPECLPLRVEGELFGTCKRYMIPFERPANEGNKKKKGKEDERMKRAKSDLHDLALRIMNHYFAVVRSTKAIYISRRSTRETQTGSFVPKRPSTGPVAIFWRSAEIFSSRACLGRATSLPNIGKAVLNVENTMRSSSSRTYRRYPLDNSTCLTG